MLIFIDVLHFFLQLIVRQSTYRVNNILIQKAKDFGLEFVAEVKWYIVFYLKKRK